MIVMGIDPGYARLGYGILEYSKNKYKVIEYGSITTQAGVALSKRLYKIYLDLYKQVLRYHHFLEECHLKWGINLH